MKNFDIHNSGLTELKNAELTKTDGGNPVVIVFVIVLGHELGWW